MMTDEPLPQNLDEPPRNWIDLAIWALDLGERLWRSLEHVEGIYQLDVNLQRERLELDRERLAFESKKHQDSNQ